MPISKGKRFEVFARDGFICRYCGRRPPDVVLEIDHIQPRAADGGDDDLNLITSCFDCNRGKGAKIITEVAPRPDADLKHLALLQEEAEVKQYLEASERINDIWERVIAKLESLWLEIVSAAYSPTKNQWHIWLKNYTAAEIDYAIRITGTRFDDLHGQSEQSKASSAIRYATGVMKRVREQSESENVQ